MQYPTPVRRFPTEEVVGGTLVLSFLGIIATVLIQMRSNRNAEIAAHLASEIKPKYEVGALVELVSDSDAQVLKSYSGFDGEKPSYKVRLSRGAQITFRNLKTLSANLSTQTVFEFEIVGLTEK
jgi:hypothetical protein